MDAEMFSLSRPEAAAVVGLTDAQLKNYQMRYAPFPEKKEGTGRHAQYSIRDVMKLAAMVQMIEDGFTPAAAADAVSPYSVYGVLLHNRADHSQYPGTFFLTKNDEGQWVGADHPNAVSRYEVRLWPLFDKIWPRFLEAALHTSGYAKYSIDDRAAFFAEYAEKMSDIRRGRWGA